MNTVPTLFLSIAHLSNHFGEKKLRMYEKVTSCRYRKSTHKFRLENEVLGYQARKCNGQFKKGTHLFLINYNKIFLTRQLFVIIVDFNTNSFMLPERKNHRVEV
jgi:hypothetical protein